MTLPTPVSPQALTALRRRYALLVAALIVPVLLAAAYFGYRQYELQRGVLLADRAAQVDERAARLDGLLRPIRSELLRLREVARGDVAVPAGAFADARYVQRVAEAGARVHSTLDALPALLQERASQVLLVDAARSADSALLDRAAVFGELGFQVLAGDPALERVYFVDVAQRSLWLHPWLPSDDLQRAAGVDSMAPLLAGFAQRAALPRPASSAPPAPDAIGWTVWRDGQGAARVTAYLDVRRDGELIGVVAADLTATALRDLLVFEGAGRVWLVDGSGAVLADHVGAGESAPRVLSALQPPFEVRDHAALPADPEIGADFVVAARALTEAPWTLVSGLARESFDVVLFGRLRAYVLAVSGLLLLFGIGIAWQWQGFTLPSLRLADYLDRLSREPDAREPQVPVAWAPWMRLTRDTFAAWRGAAAREARTEALKSAIVDHALAAVVTADAHGLIVDFNPAAQRMFGHRRDEVLGRPVSRVIIPERFRSGHDAGMRRMQRGEAPRLMGRRLEMAALRADGSEIPVEMVIWRTTVGTETFYTASMFDLTERLHAAAEIERQRDALRQSEKLTAMGSLLAGVAHELNNPLAIVMGRASLLEAKVTDPELQADAVRIREAAERCGRIVRTFLAMARKKPAAHRPVQLNDLVRGALDLLAYNLRTGGIEITQQLDAALPAVLADADQIGQVVLNLLVNAQQALAQAEAPRRVLVATGVDDAVAAARVWLRIADNGPGIAPEHRGTVFDAFFTTKAEGVGTGLGLAVSRSVASEHGGELTLEELSPWGRGASFRLALPLRRAADEAGVPPDTALAPVEAASTRVLVVDDEAEVSGLMRDVLENAGYEVAEAESGAVALELLSAARFDAIVSDLRMPEMDGIALWEAVRERHPALARRMVFVTGDTLSAAAVDFMRRTGCSCVEKPFAPADLLAQVAAALHRASTSA